MGSRLCEAQREGAGLDKVKGRERGGEHPRQRSSVCEAPEVDETWQLRGSWETDPQ